MESEGRQMKQGLIMYIKKSRKNPPVSDNENSEAQTNYLRVDVLNLRPTSVLLIYPDNLSINMVYDLSTPPGSNQ
jgi:hypothetical protein